jgi:ribosomal-protein-alanine N-acetyltransferase
MLVLNFHPFPQLFTKRLILRRMIDEDANDLFVLRSDKNVMKYIDRPLAHTADDALQLIKKIQDSLSTNDGITWGICLQNNSTLIGTIGYWRIVKGHYRAEIGYLISPQHQGKGLMQEAITEILRFGFEEMKLHSVEANVNPENAASIKLLERNRFVKEAYFKENYYSNGRFLDSAIYSLLAPNC